MAIISVQNERYTVDPLYQWDKNQVLEIKGLSLPSVPEIHFTNETMDRAIVRQAAMNSAGVITVDVPNSLLQKPYKIKAYVCIYEGETFETKYLIEIPVKARKKPSDYTLEDDLEVYSFNALENLVNNTVVTLTANNKALESAVNAKCAETIAEANDIVARGNKVLWSGSESIATGESMTITVPGVNDYSVIRINGDTYIKVTDTPVGQSSGKNPVFVCSKHFMYNRADVDGAGTIYIAIDMITKVAEIVDDNTLAFYCEKDLGMTAFGMDLVATSDKGICLVINTTDTTDIKRSDMSITQLTINEIVGVY